MSVEYAEESEIEQRLATRHEAPEPTILGTEVSRRRSRAVRHCVLRLLLTTTTALWTPPFASATTVCACMTGN